MMSSPKASKFTQRRLPDYSERRRQTVLSLLREASSQAAWCGLTNDAKLLYAVGALMCNEAGVMSHSDVLAVTKNRFALTYAAQLLDEAGAA